jgi:hypothetical protein
VQVDSYCYLDNPTRSPAQRLTAFGVLWSVIRKVPQDQLLAAPI